MPDETGELTADERAERKELVRQAGLNGVTTAFPSEDECGMTLREYLAAKAMQGYLASCTGKTAVEDVAQAAVWCADALLVELEKRQ